MEFLGIDIGCSAIKFGRVNLDDEITLTGFDMLALPQPAETHDFTDALLHILEITEPSQAVGIGFPSVVWEDGILDLEIKFNDIWTEISGQMRMRGIPCFALNDADAAGVAEVCRPQAEDLRKGVTIVITLGSGIGSGTFLNGNLFPNTEFGMLEVNGVMAEKMAAASVKRRDSLSNEAWAARLQDFLSTMEILMSPDHIVLGGGISADFDEYKDFLKLKRTKILPAYYRNQAGVIGAAMYAAQKVELLQLRT